MKIELLQSTVGESAARQFCIAALIDDRIAIDAGTIGMLWPVERQNLIKDVFLSHSHIDHVASLPLFLDNVYTPGDDAPTVHACEATQHCLQTDLFNDRLWPDFFRLSEEETPFLHSKTLVAEESVELNGLRITPVPLNHVVPTMGFIVQEPECAVAFVSDTNRTERIWEILSRIPNLQAVFLECSFPDSHGSLAEKAGHLCPSLFLECIQRLPTSVRVIAWHLKPAYYDRIADELCAVERRGLEIGVPGTQYLF